MLLLRRSILGPLSPRGRGQRDSEAQSFRGMAHELPTGDPNPGPMGCLLFSSLQNRHPLSLCARQLSSQPALFAHLVPLTQQCIFQEMNTVQVRKVFGERKGQQKNDHCATHSLDGFRALAARTLETCLRSNTLREEIWRLVPTTLPPRGYQCKRSCRFAHSFTWQAC